MKISVFATVRRLREQRWRMVFVLQQYEFIYEFTMRRSRGWGWMGIEGSLVMVHVNSLLL